MAGIYLHIPFCKQACTYCDFHFSVNMAGKSELVHAILKEMNERKGYLENEKVETIYFGGGTPSVLSEEELNPILEKLRKEFLVSTNVEVTLECNPDDLTEEKLQQLKKAGINRLSIGLQSFNDQELKWMNRAHTSTESVSCVKLAQDAGFDNITIDLIYGSRFQTMHSWHYTLEKAINLKVQHISAYNLTIESKTKLGLSYQMGSEPEVNEEFSAEQFNIMLDKLGSNGFVHYEISNFGKEGFFSKHNSSYWLGANYLGLGPSAHSFNGISRQWNVRSNAAYVQKLNAKECYFEKEILTEQEKYNEYILTRLRTMWGCSKHTIEKDFGAEMFHLFEKILKKHKKYFNVEGDVVKLNTDGKLKADFLASEFFI